VSQEQSIKTFGAALRHLREKKGMSYVDVADLTRADKKRVKAWEADSPPYPNTIQLKALYACFPPLKHYTHLMTRAQGDEIAFKMNKGVYEADAQLKRGFIAGLPRDEARRAASDAFDRELTWIPPIDKSPPPADVAAPLPKPKTFGEALRQARVREGLSVIELGPLIGVDPAAVRQWENGNSQPVVENYNKLTALLPVLCSGPTPISRDIPKPAGAASGRTKEATAPGTAWRSRVRDALDKADADVSGAAFTVRALVELPETTARQVADALNKLIEWARAVKTALPIHVVEHGRSYPGNGVTAAPALAEPVLPVSASAQPDYGWRRCATLGGKGHLWNPAPGAVPPRSTDGLPDVTCPHHAKQAQPVPDLPGAIGAGAKYGAAMVELVRATMVRRGAEAFYEEAKLGEEIAQEEVTKAKAALEGAADKEATDAA